MSFTIGTAKLVCYADREKRNVEQMAMTMTTRPNLSI